MSTPTVPASGALEAVGVSMTYGQGDTLAVSDAHFAVRPGETVAITGPSGCGKSSLLYCLGGVLKPTSGQVLLDGTDVATLGDVELSDLRARALGFVFQFGELVPELTLAENVGLPLMIAGERRKKMAPRVQEALERLEIAKLGDRRPAQVSGGQAQRVAVARALIHRPRYLLADEPTGSLDRRSGTLVLDAMLGMARDQGTGVVIVTHDQEVAAKADRVIAMTDGIITAEAVGAVDAEDRSASRA